MPNLDLPIIIENRTSGLGSSSQAHSQNTGPSRKLSIAKALRFIVPVLAVVLIVEVIIGIKTITTPNPSAGKIRPLTGGKITLVSSPSTVQVGGQVAVKVRIDTGGRSINGADVLIKYDPKKMSISKNDIKTGAVFSEFPLQDVDSTNGRVKLSGISAANATGFSGINTLSTLTFTALSSGQAPISVDYKPGVTTDSNLIETSTSQDILDKVTDVTIKVSDK